jgi:hypothetical protein
MAALTLSLSKLEQFVARQDSAGGSEAGDHRRRFVFGAQIDRLKRSTF